MATKPSSVIKATVVELVTLKIQSCTYGLKQLLHLKGAGIVPVPNLQKNERIIHAVSCSNYGGTRVDGEALPIKVYSGYRRYTRAT